jgi:hypothetical protein
MTNTETIKSALIKQIIDSGSTLPLSVLEGNIDLLINTALAERYDAIYNKVIGSHITEPELTVEDLKAGDWYIADVIPDNKWLFRFTGFKQPNLVKTDKCIELKSKTIYSSYGDYLCRKHEVLSIRHATREEIIKYFPHEFEIDSHGANDIPQVTDPQL